MASSAYDLVWLEVSKYCSLLGFGKLELNVGTGAHVCAHGAGVVFGGVSSGTIQRYVLVHLLPASTRPPL